jgi:hypothetical protein
MCTCNRAWTAGARARCVGLAVIPLLECRRTRRQRVCKEALVVQRRAIEWHKVVEAVAGVRSERTSRVIRLRMPLDRVRQMLTVQRRMPRIVALRNRTARCRPHRLSGCPLLYTLLFGGLFGEDD